MLKSESCKGTCVRYKAKKPPLGKSRYASGQKRCQICELFIEWPGLWCPCCGFRLRTKPRNLQYKAKLRARIEVESKNMLGVIENKLNILDYVLDSNPVLTSDHNIMKMLLSDFEKIDSQINNLLKNLFSSKYVEINNEGFTIRGEKINEDSSEQFVYDNTLYEIRKRHDGGMVLSEVMFS